MFQSQVSDFRIDQSLQSQMDSTKFKLNLFKNDPTISFSSENQISTGSLSHKNVKSSENSDESDFKVFLNKKSRKLKKSKIIEKNYIQTSRDRHGKFRRILQNKEALKVKLQLKKAQQLKSATKLSKIQQNNLLITYKHPQFKRKTPIVSIKNKKIQKIILDECADIRMIGFNRKQIQKKRDDLLKRKVDDWNFIQKLRSDKRQLRILRIG